MLGKLKATCFGDFVSDSVMPGLGTTADVEMGVVFIFVVVVEEFRVAQITGYGTVVRTFASSAWITTSGLIRLTALPDMASNML